MKKLLLSFLMISIVLSCKYTVINPSKKIKIALKYASNNAAEIQKVIDHYSKLSDDSLKLKAACFLIENMVGKGSLIYLEVNDKGICSYDLFKKDIGIDSILKLKKKFEDSTHNGKIVFKNSFFQEDLKLIKSSELIENIDYAFMAWKLPWSKTLSFTQFKEYILPYRISDEALQNWRKNFFLNRKWIFDRIKYITDRIKIAGIINDSMRKAFHYIHASIHWFPGQFSLAELYATKGGRCDDLNMIVGYWLRSIGIPVAYEYTPLWGNSNYGGHSWISILDSNGKFVPMNAVYDNPIRDSLPFKGAHLTKAFRRLYQVTLTKAGTIMPENIDITKEYVDASNYTMFSEPNLEKSIYIGVLNGLYWNPIPTFKRVSNNRVTFMNLARNILYAAITKNSNDSIRTVGLPFLISKNGDIQYFKEDTNHFCDIKVNIGQAFLAHYYKKCLRVIYWNNNTNKWIYTNSINTLHVNPDSVRNKNIYILFKRVPSNAIYRIIDTNKNLDNYTGERPFIFNKEDSLLEDY